jgi:hypothetical protein
VVQVLLLNMRINISITNITKRHKVVVSLLLNYQANIEMKKREGCTLLVKIIDNDPRNINPDTASKERKGELFI